MEEIQIAYGKSKVLMDRFGITYPTLRKILGKAQGTIKNKKIAQMVRDYALRHLNGRLITHNSINI